MDQAFQISHFITELFYFVLGSGFLASCEQEVLEQGLVEIRSELPEIMVGEQMLVGLVCLKT